MKEQKQTYLSPETETLVVRFEGVICVSKTLNALNAIQATEYIDYGGISDYDEL